jgi:hypothetical protein
LIFDVRLVGTLGVAFRVGFHVVETSGLYTVSMGVRCRGPETTASVGQGVDKGPQGKVGAVDSTLAIREAGQVLGLILDHLQRDDLGEEFPCERTHTHLRVIGCYLDTGRDLSGPAWKEDDTTRAFALVP